MYITVINGSPKGKYSITLQTVRFLEKRFAAHEWQIVNAGQSIHALEKDFTKAKEALVKADMIIFSYPVYTFIAPSQLHRFIELMKENKVNVEDKFATSITTSKHFYDVTAHRYVEDNCMDMKMKVITGFSADMDDLLKNQGQKQACDFMEYVEWCVKNDNYEPIPAAIKEQFETVVEDNDVTNQKGDNTADNQETIVLNEAANNQKPGDVVIIADCTDKTCSLNRMITEFRNEIPYKTRVVNLREFPFKGGCLGCFYCSGTGKCVYNDHFDDFLRNEIQTANAIVFAFEIKDHSMGARFKMYDDRQFCNGHRTVTMGMPMGYLVSGKYSVEQNLRMIIEGRAEVGGNFLAGVATDESDWASAVKRLAATLDFALKKKYLPPQNFYGIGGMKIFRDLIYLMKGIMTADHKFYKKHHQYDFPQRKKGTVLTMYAVGILMHSDKLRRKLGNKLNEGMVSSYEKVVEGKK